jgi:transcriptional regulator with XRE-family HTH domain
VPVALHLCCSATPPYGASEVDMTGRREKRENNGFAARLRQVIEAYGSASGLAKAIERSEGAVRKWLRGESEPNVTDLRSVCEETGTSIEWLVAGRGQREAMPLGVREVAPPYENPALQHVDTVLLEGVVVAIEEELLKTGLTLPPTKRSVLVAHLYDLSHERREVDREAVARLVKLAG